MRKSSTFHRNLHLWSSRLRPSFLYFLPLNNQTLATAFVRNGYRRERWCYQYRYQHIGGLATQKSSERRIGHCSRMCRRVQEDSCVGTQFISKSLLITEINCKARINKKQIWRPVSVGTRRIDIVYIGIWRTRQKKIFTTTHSFNDPSWALSDREGDCEEKWVKWMTRKREYTIRIWCAI